jgi:hypothetical protein
VEEVREEERRVWTEKVKRAESVAQMEKENGQRVQGLMQEMERNCRKLSEKQIELLEEIERYSPTSPRHTTHDTRHTAHGTRHTTHDTHH